MAHATQLISLPLTFAAIRSEFSGRDNAGLRGTLRALALRGSVMSASRTVALTACGRASLDEVQEVLDAEYSERGYSGFFVGPAGPEADAPIVAYLDQPLTGYTR